MLKAQVDRIRGLIFNEEPDAEKPDHVNDRIDKSSVNYASKKSWYYPILYRLLLISILRITEWKDGIKVRFFIRSTNQFEFNPAATFFYFLYILISFLF